MSDKFKRVFMYSVQLYKKDNKGNILKNEDGTTKLFTVQDKFVFLNEDVTDWFHPEYLEEVSDE